MLHRMLQLARWRLRAAWLASCVHSAGLKPLTRDTPFYCPHPPPSRPSDVHAGNLLVLPDGRVGFIDFGIVGRIRWVLWAATTAGRVGVATECVVSMSLGLAASGCATSAQPAPSVCAPCAAGVQPACRLCPSSPAPAPAQSNPACRSAARCPAVILVCTAVPCCIACGALCKASPSNRQPDLPTSPPPPHRPLQPGDVARHRGSAAGHRQPGLRDHGPGAGDHRGDVAGGGHQGGALPFCLCGVDALCWETPSLG